MGMENRQFVFEIRGEKEGNSHDISLESPQKKDERSLKDFMQDIADAYFLEMADPAKHAGSIRIQDAALNYVLMQAIDQGILPANTRNFGWVSSIFVPGSFQEELALTSKFFSGKLGEIKGFATEMNALIGAHISPDERREKKEALRRKYILALYNDWKGILGKRPPDMSGIEAPYQYIVRECSFKRNYIDQSDNSRTCEIGTNTELDSERKIDLVKIEKGSDGRYIAHLVQCKNSPPSKLEYEKILIAHKEFVQGILSKEVASFIEDNLNDGTFSTKWKDFIASELVNEENVSNTYNRLVSFAQKTIEDFQDSSKGNDTRKKGDMLKGKGKQDITRFARTFRSQEWEDIIDQECKGFGEDRKSALKNAFRDFLSKNQGQNENSRGYLHKGNTDFYSVIYSRDKETNSWGVLASVRI